MSEYIEPSAQICAALIEGIGILTIVVFAIWSLSLALFQVFQHDDTDRIYKSLRQRLGRGILLGLELLVAADIIHTVAVELTYETVGVLAAVVLIRTFLSFSLEVELSGRWPWQKENTEDASPN